VFVGLPPIFLCFLLDVSFFFVIVKKKKKEEEEERKEMNKTKPMSYLYWSRCKKIIIKK
jgi:preprotein translocase subunit YajC